MKVTKAPTTENNNLNRNHRKDKNGLYSSVIAVDKETGNKVVDIRTYWPGNVRCYACVWVTVPNVDGVRVRNNEPMRRLYLNGSGYAGGYGYDKESAAIAVALKSAGFEFDEGISGVGQSAVISAVNAICDYYGVDAHVLRIHG